jgi:RNA polymerase sigma-70 factor (ECF subfamily)
MSIELHSEDLLARVAGQDVAALGELYDRHAPRVYGLITHILVARDGAEDLLQQVFVRLWVESASLSQEGGSVEAWLVVTAREAAVDRLRTLDQNAPGADVDVHTAKPGKEPDTGGRKSRAAAPAPSTAKSLKEKAEGVKLRPARANPFPAAGAVPPAWLPRPKEISLIDERLALLHKAIDQLPKPQRQALELAVFGGLSESEIAVAMGEPLAKAQRALRAAVTFVKHRRRAVCGTWAANI